MQCDEEINIMLCVW